jgi:phosphohistidine phosphatase
VKRLTVIRHAQAENQKLGEDDSTRPLADAGVEASLRLGDMLREKRCIPELIVCSIALRARETVERIIERLGTETNIVEEVTDLYEGGVEEILVHLAALPESTGHIFLVGHNPTVTELVNSLCGPVVTSMKAGGAAHIELPNASRWDSIIGKGNLVFYAVP